MKNRKLILIVSLVLAMAMSLGGTLAYLQDTDADVNTMVLGNVTITQNEQERDANGELVGFNQNKPALPAVYKEIAWDDEFVEFNGVGYKVFDDSMKNVIDKMVTVTNTGNTNAYVRTLVAIEAPNYDPNDLIHYNWNSTDCTQSGPVTVEINGVQYVVFAFTYKEAVAPKATTAPSLVQLFLDKATTNEDVAAYGDTWEVLALSQAIQADGFADPETALNEGFGVVNATNVASWFGDWETWAENGKIDTPSDEWPSNAPVGDLWDGSADTSWAVEDKTEYVLNTAEQLAGLAELVNGGNSFAGKTIKLDADLDLAGKAWTSIGNWDYTFEGNFDGQGYTIYNLYINEPTAEGVGLIGVAQNAVIKGINVHNADVTAYNMAAAIIASPYVGCTISDCHVSGNINIVAEYAYAGGIMAYGYVDIDNCSVIANGTGVIKAADRNAVGGIAAWMLEGDNRITNCRVENLEITGWANVGCISGFIHYSNVFDGNTAKNIVLTKTREGGNPTIGLAAGGYSYNANKPSTITNNTFTNVELNGQSKEFNSYDELYGSEYDGKDNANFVMDGNTTSNITNNTTIYTP